MEDKKKIARMLVIGALKKSPKPESESDMGGDMGEGEEQDEPDTHVAAKEVMDALKSGDVDGFASALESFVKMCDSSEDSSDEGE